MKLVRRRRLPGLLNISGALVVVLAVAVIALHAGGEAPPAVAEFAPQAQQILKAPAELTSRFGNGSDGAAVGPALPPSPATSAAGLPPDAVLRRCVGDPPRQIEDPQSPPCVPYWHGNNDGSTYKGVSTNTITVGVPNSCNNDQANCVNDLFSFFNHRFELYGRRLVPVDTSGDGEGCGDSNGCPDAQRSAAETADQVRHIFASSDCADTWFYCDALAERGIISVTTRPSYSSAVLARDSPYLWQYAMAKNDEFANIGRWVCSRLAGWPARHAGDPLLQTSRVFGIVSNVEQTGEESDDSSLTDSLAACGIRNIDNIENGDNNAASNGTAATGIARLRADHVTTVICLCHTLVLSQFQNSADSQGYMPEWLVSTYLLNDADWSLHELGPAPSQLAHTFGVTFEPRQVPLAENPAYWAYREPIRQPGSPTRRSQRDRSKRCIAACCCSPRAFKWPALTSRRPTSRGGCTARRFPTRTR